MENGKFNNGKERQPSGEDLGYYDWSSHYDEGRVRPELGAESGVDLIPDDDRVSSIPSIVTDGFDDRGNPRKF